MIDTSENASTASTSQMIREIAKALSPVTIRYREVIATKPAYGRFGEYQVVQGRKVLYRADLREQAEKWAAKNHYTVSQ